MKAKKDWQFFPFAPKGSPSRLRGQVDDGYLAWEWTCRSDGGVDIEPWWRNEGVGKVPKNMLAKITRHCKRQRPVVKQQAALFEGTRHRAQAALFEEPKPKKPRDGSCDRSKLAKRIREVHAMPVDRQMRPLRNHLLRLAINSAARRPGDRQGRAALSQVPR